MPLTTPGLGRNQANRGSSGRQTWAVTFSKQAGNGHEKGSPWNALIPSIWLFIYRLCYPIDSNVTQICMDAVLMARHSKLIRNSQNACVRLALSLVLSVPLLLCLSIPSFNMLIVSIKPSRVVLSKKDTHTF